MNILGDIGNTETKVFLVSSNNKIIKKITFLTPLEIASKPKDPTPEKRSKTDEKLKGLMTSKILLRTLDLVGL